jgi:YNFM family putative membrane transporter
VSVVVDRPAGLRSSRFFPLYLATVAVYADMYITQPVLPLITREFGVAPATAGLTVSAVVLAIAVSSSFYGPLGDAFGRKPVMMWSCALVALPTMLCAVAPSFSVLLLCRMAQGLLIPGVSAVGIAYIGDQSGPASLGTNVGGFIAAGIVGGLTGRVVTGLVTDLLSWRAAFVLLGGVTLAAAAAMGAALPRGSTTGQVGWTSAYRDMFGHFRDRRLVGAFLIGATLFFGFIGIFTYLPYYLTGAPFHLSTSLVASVYVVYLAGVVVSPTAGRLSARISRRTIIGAGLVIAMLGIAITLAHSLPLIVAGLVVLCIGMFTAQATAPAYVNATARTAKGGANALYLGFYYVGATVGSVLPGYAWQALRWPGVVATCTAMFLVALVADWRLCAGDDGGRRSGP